jgi:hypothetical protein
VGWPRGSSPLHAGSPLHLLKPPAEAVPRYAAGRVGRRKMPVSLLSVQTVQRRSHKCPQRSTAAGLGIDSFSSWPSWGSASGSRP